jgi:acetylornithine deacetylase/succinyl-diaminopimelate desuccinylase-like protein
MSHLDVVPATNDLGAEWLYEPFAGASGRINLNSAK